MGMNQNLMERITSPDNLLAAWRSVRGNIPQYRRARSAGPDGVSLVDFEQDLHTQLNVLREMLLSGKYQPKPAAQFTRKKENGGQRPIVVFVHLIQAQRIAYRQIEVAIPVIIPPSHAPRWVGIAGGFPTQTARRVEGQTGPFILIDRIRTVAVAGQEIKVAITVIIPPGDALGELVVRRLPHL